ncbi:MAG TPA: DNA replication/repair protein RecF [Thermomicrobiaceae bacterium]|nr:DNA replication/repair protein RecF [Thermomicrobiaceae bacterium]
MRLTSLELDEFRLYRELRLAIPPAGLRVIGRNASGKTSLLEAVYLLATARSPRATLERDLINWRSNEEYGLSPYARVRAAAVADGHPIDLELTLAVEPERGGTRKRVKIDGLARRTVDAVGTVRVVLFEPEDLGLVLGSPSIRRRYLDISLSQLDPTYLQALSRYGKLAQQRNSLLKELGGRRDRGSREGELAYWDEEMVTYGSYLVAARLRYSGTLATHARQTFARLHGGDEELKLDYRSTVELSETMLERVRAAPPAEGQALVGRSFEQALRDRREDELRRGATLLGPHRDDLLFTLAARDLASFGSRGQQRLAVVATKLAELSTMLDIAGDRPILLLDDVLSELDSAHRELLLAAIGAAGCQVLITGTERHLLEHPALAALPLAEANGGELLAVDEPFESE